MMMIKGGQQFYYTLIISVTILTLKRLIINILK